MRIEQGLGSSFPGLRVLELKMVGLTVGRSHPALEALKREVQERVRGRFRSMDEVREQPIFRAYRDFFWRVGVDPTKSRPAGEALTRRILGGRVLPSINTAVDAYNLASVETCIAIAAFDTSRMDEGALLMRRAVERELFHGIGMERPELLKGEEVVIEDQSSGDLLAVYPYRDSDESKVQESTTDVLFMMCGVPGIDDSLLRAAAKVTEEYVGRFCRR